MHPPYKEKIAMVKKSQLKPTEKKTELFGIVEAIFKIFSI